MPPPDTMTPQARCHHGIRHLYSAALVVWLGKHPELFIKVTRTVVVDGVETEVEDNPAEEFGDFQLKLMLSVLDVVDRFDLHARVEPPP